MLRHVAGELDLRVILQATEQGERHAFDRLYLHYEGKVRYAVARAALKTGYGRDVDELVQEVWCRLMDDDRRLLRYYDPDKARFGSYIGAIAYQQTLTAIYHHRRQVPAGDSDAGSDWFADSGAARFAAELIQSDLLTKLLERAEAELSEEDRVLLREVHLNQRACRDVARDLGVRENTVHKRNERLKKKLARMVEQLMHVARPPTTSSPPPTVGASLMMMLAMQLWVGAGEDDHPPGPWSGTRHHHLGSAGGCWMGEVRG